MVEGLAGGRVHGEEVEVHGEDAGHGLHADFAHLV